MLRTHSGKIEVEDVTVDLISSADRLPTLTARTYHLSGARDPDHWALRDLQVEMAGVVITNIQARPGYTSTRGRGFLTDVRRFEPGYPPHIELSVEPCDRCNELHPWSEGFLPPVDESAPIGVEVEFVVRTHTPTQDQAAIDRARNVSQAHIDRGHDPECDQDDGPCERCAKAHAGKTILIALGDSDG
ncbi:hypothetical protein [Ornithinimicrobium murale]|uniref:hypothetical protein n=1 Tax=Ornithinimicrobium murale TaxID=1050153 RepID=UPI0013B3A231|nr:hypothetical protein [Ornithinimicrobium murale]